MSAATDLHNLLSGRFVRDVLGPAINAGATDTELMVLAESCIFGTMGVLVSHYDVEPRVAVGFMEAALNAAIDRLTDARARP